MTLVFRDVRGQRRQLGHLMSAGDALFIARLQPAIALTALRRLQVHDGVDAILRHERTPVPTMAGLPTRGASTLLPTASHAWLTREPIRRTLKTSKNFLK
jgi:hypothetical protein